MRSNTQTDSQTDFPRVLVRFPPFPWKFCFLLVSSHNLNFQPRFLDNNLLNGTIPRKLRRLTNLKELYYAPPH